MSKLKSFESTEAQLYEMIKQVKVQKENLKVKAKTELLQYKLKKLKEFLEKNLPQNSSKIPQ